MGKLYILVNIAFDYNDEIHSSVEGDAGEPIKAYKSKEKANAECLTRNLDEFQNVDLTEYCYDISDIIEDTDAFLKILHGDKVKKEKTPPVPVTICSGYSCLYSFTTDAKFCPNCGTKRAMVEEEDEEEDSDSFTIPDDISRETLAKLYDLVSLQFYKVVEVETE